MAASSHTAFVRLTAFDVDNVVKEVCLAMLATEILFATLVVSMISIDDYAECR